ncbi:MAG: hypothetical protein J6A77_13260 [Lachnospiraceae bacterium]|nr:hypothetical protein [Lachnospiraceae bacterium]
MVKKTGFVGYESEDIVLYLARILTALDRKVAIVDRTEQEMLLELLGICQGKKNGAGEREGEFAGIWITDQGSNLEEFDHIFFLFGYRLLHPKLYECECLVMVTDGVPAHASLLRRLGKWERKQFLILRNLIPMKHTEQYLTLLAEEENNYYRLSYNEKDIRRRCSLGSAAGCGIRLLSAEMKQLLLLLLEFLEEECHGIRIQQMLKKL